MPWDFAGNGFRGWVRWGERRNVRQWWVDPNEADIFRIPDDGKLPEWETLPEQDEGEL